AEMAVKLRWNYVPEGCAQAAACRARLCRGVAGRPCFSNDPALLDRQRFPPFLARFATPHLGHPLSRIHGAATLSRAAVARRGLIVVIQVVVPDQFFSRGNVAD